MRGRLCSHCFWDGVKVSNSDSGFLRAVLALLAPRSLTLFLGTCVLRLVISSWTRGPKRGHVLHPTSSGQACTVDLEKLRPKVASQDVLKVKLPDWKWVIVGSHLLGHYLPRQRSVFTLTETVALSLCMEDDIPSGCQSDPLVLDPSGRSLPPAQESTAPLLVTVPPTDRLAALWTFLVRSPVPARAMSSSVITFFVLQSRCLELT